jgi:hypothetical protein
MPTRACFGDAGSPPAGALPGERNHIRTVRVLSAPLNVDIPSDQISPSNLVYLHRILTYVEIFRFETR